jgi:hypothetical protein
MTWLLWMPGRQGELMGLRHSYGKAQAVIKQPK